MGSTQLGPTTDSTVAVVGSSARLNDDAPDVDFPLARPNQGLGVEGKMTMGPRSDTVPSP